MIILIIVIIIIIIIIIMSRVGGTRDDNYGFYFD
jgi:hypothetical protein